VLSERSTAWYVFSVCVRVCDHFFGGIFSIVSLTALALSRVASGCSAQTAYSVQHTVHGMSAYLPTYLPCLPLRNTPRPHAGHV
jgi:hypothetical protein